MPSVVDNYNDPADIANSFAKSYKSVFSSAASSSDKLSEIRRQIDDGLHSCNLFSQFLISGTDVAAAVDKLNHGKWDGDNSLSSDYFIHASNDLYVHLALLLTGIINHGTVIDDFRISSIIPIPKSKNNVCDSSAYRGIALSSIIGKLVDHILLERFSDLLFTSDLQFGFKRGHSTTMCTAVLKEAVAYYTSNQSSVYCVFLDATKAFDRVNYAKLFSILIERKLPPVLLRFMLNLYSDQLTRVSWNNVFSQSIAILNGVRQGGIISPVLFCVYLDGLLERLKNSKIGCFIGNIYLGVLGYADDVTLLAPTADAIRKMLVICNGYANEFSIKFNANKTKCILFTPPGKRAATVRPDLYIDNRLIEYVSEWPHLGNIISVTQTDSACILHRRNQFIGQINDVLCIFNKVNVVLKLDLLQKYCLSLYGSVLWDLNDPQILRVCTAWRAAIRRILRLPLQSHSIVVSLLAGKLPLFEELSRRLLLFHFACIRSSNSVVRSVFVHSIVNGFAQSPHGRNLLFLCDYLRFKPHLLLKDNEQATVLFLFSKHCQVLRDNSYVDHIGVLAELLLVRSGMMDLFPNGVMSEEDINDYIECLCCQ